MTTAKFDFRWGVPALDEERKNGTFIPGFILATYHKLDLSPQEMMLIVHLSAYHYNTSSGQARPSLRTIADLMGYKRDTSVRNMIKHLEEMKLLNVTRIKGKPSIYDFGNLAQRCLALQGGNAPKEYPPHIVPHSNGVPHREGGHVPHPNGTEEVEDKTEKPKTLAPDGADGDADPTPFQQLQVAFVELWFDGNPSQYGRAGLLAHMCMGTATQPGYKEYNLKTPITADDLRLFATAYLKSKPDGFTLPTSPATLNQNLYAWQKKRDRQIQRDRKAREVTDYDRAMMNTYEALRGVTHE